MDTKKESLFRHCAAFFNFYTADFLTVLCHFIRHSKHSMIWTVSKVIGCFATLHIRVRDVGLSVFPFHEIFDPIRHHESGMNGGMTLSWELCVIAVCSRRWRIVEDIVRVERAFFIEQRQLHIPCSHIADLVCTRSHARRF
jgi:hypothetical protein